MQLNLKFLEVLIPETCVWEVLDDEQRAEVIEALAQAIAKTVSGEAQVEEKTND